MTDRSGDPPASSKPAADRLDSWKEIAAYVGRDVSTVQRWEKRERMPVHRHLHDKLGSVYAYRSDLDEWLRTRHIPAVPRDAPSAVAPIPPVSPDARPSRRGRSKYLVLGLASVVLAAGAVAWFAGSEPPWRNPLADASFQRITDFEGVQEAAAISRDGRFVAFLSDRDGPTDVWVTQVGSGQFHNLTRGRMADLVNPSVRMLGFSPDGTYVTFWARTDTRRPEQSVGVWAVPTLGGEPRPLLDGVAEYDWSANGSRLVFHTPGPGDPMFASDGNTTASARPLFTAPAGEHSHFPLWAPDGRFVYFVKGSLVTNKLDVWRVPPDGGSPERITFHDSLVTYPVLLNRRTLLYLAKDADGSGPWVYGIDPDRHVPHRLTPGPDRYTSLSASADGHRLVATLSTPRHTLWHVPIASTPAIDSLATRLALPTMAGSWPREGGGSLFYVANTGKGASIWKVSGDATTELWTVPGSQLLGGVAISADASRLAFSVRLHAQSLLYVMQPDGTNARVVTTALSLQGAPAWAPDGQSVVVAALDPVEPHVFRVPLDGTPPVRLTREYSTDPVASPDGLFVVFSGADVGPTFSLHAVGQDGTAHALPPLTLTRGARRAVFAPGGHELLVLRGEIQHKNVWRIDLATGAAVQLTNFSPEFAIRDFDVSSDGRDMIVERIREQSDVVLLDLPRGGTRR